jgi:predicted Zn-ribbon and HTH transcriptional regulator
LTSPGFLLLIYTAAGAVASTDPIPDWVVFGLALILAGICWFCVVIAHYERRRLYRLRNRLCLRCAYDLGGNASGRCPECGTEMVERPPTFRLSFAGVGCWIMTAVFPELRLSTTPDEGGRIVDRAFQESPVSSRVLVILVTVLAFSPVVVLEILHNGVAVADSLYTDISEIAACVAGAILWVAFVRRRIGPRIRRELSKQGLPFCRQCGYDLFGSVSGMCPECGTEIEAPRTRRCAT